MLRYAGRVGTGFTEAELVRLGGLLEPLATAESPFDGRQPPKLTHLVRAGAGRARRLHRADHRRHAAPALLQGAARRRGARRRPLRVIAGCTPWPHDPDPHPRRRRGLPDRPRRHAALVGGRPDEARAIRTIHAALDAGVTLIDTADAYASTSRVRPQRAADRQGAARPPRRRPRRHQGRPHAQGRAWLLDGRPEHIRAACEASLRALETDRIDLYQFHRPDPDVPYAESIGALKELRDEGKVRWVGISNATSAQLEEALGIVDVVGVQNQLALDFTSPIDKGEVAAAARTRHRVPALVAARRHRQGGRDGRGAGGARRPRRTTSRPSRSCSRGCWRSSPTIIPIPGSSRPETIADSAAAAELTLAPRRSTRSRRRWARG